MMKINRLDKSLHPKGAKRVRSKGSSGGSQRATTFYKRLLGKLKSTAIQTPKHTPFPDITKDEKAGRNNSPNVANIPNTGYMDKPVKKAGLSQ